jgi:signal transduction histidine kinase/ligand-binding sensor domain-containing protein
MKVGKCSCEKMILSFGSFIMKAFFLAVVNVMLLFPSTNVLGQQYFFTNYTVDDGLSYNEVHCMIKDHDGYLWVGTNAGLNRFDGYNFTVYKSIASDSTTIPSNVVRSLCLDHSGTLWVSTARGICTYDKNKNSFKGVSVRGQDSLENMMYESFILFEDTKKNMWAGTGAFGLLKYNPATGYFNPVLQRLPVFEKDLVNSISEEKDGSLWMTSYHHLLHFDPRNSSFKEYENKISGYGRSFTFQALKVFPDSTDGNLLFITTWGNGLVRFNKRNAEFISYKFHQNGSINLDNIVFDACQKDASHLWIASNSGLIIFDQNKLTYEYFVSDDINEKPVANTQVYSLYKDPEGVMWMGTNLGFCNIHPDKQKFISHPLWLKPPVQQYVYDEALDKIYGIRFYSNRALIIYDRKTNRINEYKIPGSDKLRAEPFSIVKDNNGLLWIGTTKGIYFFDEHKKKFQELDAEKQVALPEKTIYAGTAFKDSKGHLWFSSYSKGILMVETANKKVTSFFYDKKETGSFPLNAVIGIAGGKKNAIYACDENKGVVKLNYENGAYTWFNASELTYSSLSGATDIAIDDKDQIWVTTRNNGLVSISVDGKLNTFIKDDSGNIVDEQQSIAIDNAGKIWLTASNGIFCFDPALKSFNQFTTRDGLPARTISGGIRKLEDGSMAYSLYKGIFSFNPFEVSKTNKQFRVHLTSVLVNGKMPAYNSVVDCIDTLKLDHTENNLTIDFAATNFTNPSSILYSYRLEGIENHWSIPATVRTVNFSQLPPGNYTLRIRTGDSSSEKITYIYIIPAWWQTGFSRLCFIFAALTIIFFLVRFFTSLRFKERIAKLEQQREIEAIRTRISRDIHDEIGSGLTKIKLMSRNLFKNTGNNYSTGDISQKISVASDELIQNLGEIVWTINPANDSLGNVVAFIRNYLLKFFEENPEIKLQLDLPEPSQIQKDGVINPEVKRSLVLILKEGVTNIFKHARATEVFVSLHIEKSKIELRIRDNGIGTFVDQKNEFGNGIKNMSKRASGIGGQLTVHSTGIDGTTIHLSVPMEGL